MVCEACRHYAFLTAADFVRYRDCSIGAIKDHLPLMNRPATSNVTGMLRLPDCSWRIRVKSFDGDAVALRMMNPEKWSTRNRLILRKELQGIMADCRAEILAPRCLTVIAIGAGIGEDFYTPDAQLNRKRVSVGMRRNAKKAMRPVVAPTPDFFFSMGIPQIDMPGVSKKVGARHLACRGQERWRNSGRP